MKMIYVKVYGFWGFTLMFAILLLCESCAVKRKVEQLSCNNATVGVSIADEVVMENLAPTSYDTVPEEKIAVVDRLGKVYVMEAVRDEELGEMVISERLGAVVVEAKFRNVAERNGSVDIAFEVKVPGNMLASDWQVRITPVIGFLGNRVPLQKIYITGNNYRAAQLRGYELYEKFLSSIIPNDADFLWAYTNRKLLELFIERNFKSIAKLKQDSSFVEESVGSELFGVSRREVVEHYTKEHLIRRNERRIANKDKMFAKYVKVPIESEGVRLDSVINNPDSSVIYHYTHTIKAERGLKRIELVLGGEIYRFDRSIYTMPATEPLTYYVSSLSSFSDTSTRYTRRIVERNAMANSVSYIDFKRGDHMVCDTLRNNFAEIALLKKTIRNILGDNNYIVDSLLITASCSPEGSYSSNRVLAKKRAESIKDYVMDYIRHYRDSLNNEFWEISLDSNIIHNSKVLLENKVGTRWIAEGWEELYNLIGRDTNITDKDYMESCMLIEDFDGREKRMLEWKWTEYVKEMLYPYLRCVKFDFYMHRKGMIKDTIHTKEIDTLYMQGVDALQNRDYKKAVTLLGPYKDLNSAIAFVCMDYNTSALEILNELPQNAACNYMKSIVYARMGNEHKAVGHFIMAVEQNPAMKHRGNLDPEISQLLKKYDVLKKLDDNGNN